MSNSKSVRPSAGAFFMGGGKAEGLLRISSISSLEVPPFIVIEAEDSPTRQTEKIKAFIAAHNTPTTAFEQVAVRSSALNEDGEFASLAGAFKTFLNIPCRTPDILDAIADVQTHGQEKLKSVFNVTAPAMGVVVQQMIDAPDFAGVCLSQGINAEDNAYLIVNFKTGLGDGLVSGETAGTQLRVLRSATYRPEIIARFPFIPQLVANIGKIQAAHDGKPVDVEFAYKNGVLHTLQARRLVVADEVGPDLCQTILEQAKVAQQRADEVVFGDVLCDMADINPRELLGNDVKPLNISIFRHMFADRSVEAARAEMGYAPLHTGLLREVEGKPYVSLRTSAYSMRPGGISDTTYDKLTDIYQQQVTQNPDLQDKVEFSVFLTNAQQIPSFMQKHGIRFTPPEQDEIRNAFVRFDGAIDSRIARYCADYDTVLQAYRKKTGSLSNAGFSETLKILEEGTTLFVKTARLAFYKKASYDSRYGAEATTEAMTGLDTPSERLRHDLLRYAKGEKSKNDLTLEYGHLRPGQMDIFAPPYRTDIDRNLNLASYASMSADEIALQAPEPPRPPQHRDEAELRLLFAARENVKHEFMRAYDHIADLVLEMGATLGLSPSQLSRLSLADLIVCEQTHSLAPHIAIQAKETRNHPRLLLPSVLTEQTDLRCLEIDTKTGSFFTKQKVEAMPLIVTDDNLHQMTAQQVQGRILIMDHADPGYDFLLLYKPAGLITRIGGPASHIAIRVNEIGLPACIGSGIDLSRIDSRKTYVLDCQNGQHYEGNMPTTTPALKQTHLRRKKHAANAP